MATAVGLTNGPSTATITAEATTTTGSVITATSTLMQTAGQPLNLPMLTLHAVGNGGGSIASSPQGLTGPANSACTSKSLCTGSFALGSSVTLTATPDRASSFGGWSANCVPVQGSPNECIVVMHTNETVGVIFNNP